MRCAASAVWIQCPANAFLRVNLRNGADGISGDIEGKVARESGDEIGKRPSFNLWKQNLPEIRVYSCSFVVTTS
jgi:hypothetical protein